MSERDPLYDPEELLKSASAADAETAEEWSALYDFHKTTEELQQETEKFHSLLTFTEKPSFLNMHPTIQESVKSKAKEYAANINLLSAKLSEMSRSDVLEPVVWRAYEKARAEDVEIVRKQQEEEFQIKLQEITDQYYERKKANAENRQKQQENIAAGEPINKVPCSPMEKPVNIKPKVFKAILTGLLGIAFFATVYILTSLIVGGVIYILMKIPLIDNLVGWFFYIRGDSPDLMLAILAPTIAYTLTKWLLVTINKDSPTQGLSCIVAGVIITIIHILSLILNLIYGESILFNISQAIAGLVLFLFGISVYRAQ